MNCLLSLSCLQGQTVYRSGVDDKTKRDRQAEAIRQPDRQIYRQNDSKKKESLQHKKVAPVTD